MEQVRPQRSTRHPRGGIVTAWRCGRRPATLVVVLMCIASVGARAQARVRSAHDTHGREAVLGINYEGWDDHRDPWREVYVAVRQNTAYGPAIGRLSELSRFGLHDDKIELEAYPSFHGGYASFGLGYAANATLYARSTFSMEVFKALPAHVEGSFGYRRLNFTSPVDLFTGSIGEYYQAWLFGARVNHATGGVSGTSSMLSARRYFGDDGPHLGVQLSSGSIREDLRAQTDLAAVSSRSVVGEGVFLIRTRWMLTTRAGIGRDDASGGRSSFRTVGSMGFGVRF